MTAAARVASVPLLALAFCSAACAPAAPRFAAPLHVEDSCGSQQARMTGLESVISSSDDTVLAQHPADNDIREAARSGDGVLATWNDQPLSLPNVSKVLGETDGYARLRAAAVSAAPPGAQSRTIYLQLRDHGIPRWFALRAFDVQNVCVEGKRES